MTIFLEQEGSPWHAVCMTKTMLTISSAAEKYGDSKMSKTIFHGTVSGCTSIQEKKKMPAVYWKMNEKILSTCSLIAQDC